MGDGNYAAETAAQTAHAGAAMGADARYRAIVETVSDAILVIDEAGAVITFNPAAERLFGYAEHEVVGRCVLNLTPGPPRDDLTGHAGAPWTIGVSAQIEGLRKDGSTFPMELSLTGWRADGHGYFTGVVRDVSEQVRAQRLQQLLLGELNHRVKNSLAAVQAVACQTLRNAPDLAAAQEALNSRLVALAKGHDILTRQSWEGADLSEVISEAIEAHGAPERFAVAPVDARLTPKVALAMSMALHELCTNAAKYGALSTDRGGVDIEITRGRNKLRIVWREHGGPSVAEPTRKGFGSRMLEGLARDLEGEARLDFQSEGLVCVIAAPMAGSPDPPPLG
jgi:PAS domain S-box-containing protein